MRHKHADLIHKWAEGEIIQCKLLGTTAWLDLKFPDWDCETAIFRVKPTPLIQSLMDAYKKGRTIQYREIQSYPTPWYNISQKGINIDLYPFDTVWFKFRILPEKIKREGWINIGEFNKDGRYAGSTIFDSKECALDNKPERWITTTRIEWEEEI